MRARRRVGARVISPPTQLRPARLRLYVPDGLRLPPSLRSHWSPRPGLSAVTVVQKQFIYFDGTTAADSTTNVSTSTATDGTKNGAILVNVDGIGACWIRVYTSAV